MPKKINQKLSNDNDELTLTELRFIEEFVDCLNATQAYMVVYPDAGYASARSSSARLLTKDNIQREIKKRISQQSMPKEEVLRRLSDQAKATLFSFVKVDDDGHVYFNFKDEEAKRHFHLIKKIKSRKHETFNAKTEEGSIEHWVEVELHDSQKALELLGRYHSLFTDNVNINDRKVIKVTFKREE